MGIVLLNEAFQTGAQIAGASSPDWYFLAAIGAMASALVWLYKDTRADRKAYSEKLEKLIESSNESKNKQTASTDKLTEAIDRLNRDSDDRHNRMIQMIDSVKQR